METVRWGKMLLWYDVTLACIEEIVKGPRWGSRKMRIGLANPSDSLCNHDQWPTTPPLVTTPFALITDLNSESEPRRYRAYLPNSGCQGILT